MAWAEEEDMACVSRGRFTLFGDRSCDRDVGTQSQRDFALTRAGSDELGSGGAGRRPTRVHRHHQ